MVSHENVKDYVMALTLQRTVSCPFSVARLMDFDNFSFSSVTREFAWLKKYVNNVVDDSRRSELKSVIYPVFCYSYITLLKRKGIDCAELFFRRNNSYFPEKNISWLPGLKSIEDLKMITDVCEDFKKSKMLSGKRCIKDLESAPNFSDILSRHKAENLKLGEKIQSIKDLNGILAFSHFLRAKYLIKMSPDVLQELVQELDNIESVALVYIMSFCLYFDDLDPEENPKENGSTSVSRGSEESTEKINKGSTHADKINEGSTHEDKVNEGSTHTEIEKVNGESTQTGGKENKKSLTVKYFKCILMDNIKIGEFAHNEMKLFPGDVCISKEKLAVGVGHRIYVLDCYNKHESNFLQRAKKITFPNNNIVAATQFKITLQADRISCLKYTNHKDPSVIKLLTGSIDGNVKLLDPDSLETVESYRHHEGPVLDIEACVGVPELFATASKDCSACLWTMEPEGKLLRKLIGHRDAVNCVKFHPNSLYIASGSADSTIRIWDIQNGTCIRALHHFGDAPPNEITSLLFTQDGNCLYSASKGTMIKTYDMRELSLSHFHTCDLKQVEAVTKVFALDNTLTAFFNGTVCLFDTRMTRSDVNCSIMTLYKWEIYSSSNLENSPQVLVSEPGQMKFIYINKKEVVTTRKRKRKAQV